MFAADELLRSNGSAAFAMTTLAMVKCQGEQSYSMCRTWEFGDLPKSAIQNMGEIESAKVLKTADANNTGVKNVV